MFMKILGVIDLIIAVLFSINGFYFKFLPSNILLIMALYLIIKGLIFVLSADVASALDIVCGLIILSAILFTIPKALIVIVVFYLIQKAIFSMAS